MPNHNPEPFSNETIYHFIRQTMNALIDVCEATGDTTQLNSIASGVTSLRESMHAHASEEPTDYFPDPE